MGHRTKGVNVASHERSSEAIKWGALHADLGRVHAGDPDLHPVRTSRRAPTRRHSRTSDPSRTCFRAPYYFLHRRHNNDATADTFVDRDGHPRQTRTLGRDLRPEHCACNGVVPLLVAVTTCTAPALAATETDDHHDQRHRDRLRTRRRTTTSRRHDRRVRPDSGHAATTPSRTRTSRSRRLNSARPRRAERSAYTITVHNNGPSIATGVHLTDTAPANVTFARSRWLRATPTVHTATATARVAVPSSLDDRINGQTVTMTVAVDLVS